MTKTRLIYWSVVGVIWTTAACSEPIANRLSKGQVRLDVFFEAFYFLRSDTPVPVLFIASVDSSWTQFWSIFFVVDPFSVRFRNKLEITLNLFAPSQLFTENRSVKSNLASASFFNGSIESFKTSLFHFSFNNLINLKILWILQTIKIKFLVMGILDNSRNPVKAFSYFFKIYVKWAGTFFCLLCLIFVVIVVS